MIPDTTYRSEQEEIMDDFEMTGPVLKNTLFQLDRINNWLGGNGVTLSALEQMWARHPKDQLIKIIDLGCGSGAMLRRIAKIAKNENRKVHLIGIDANNFILEVAKELSTNYPEISYKQMLIPSEAFEELSYDIVLSTLFLHHFKDREIISLLAILKRKANLGIIVNDLHRNKLAYFLFFIISRFITNAMVRQDGLTSILRAFKRNDLINYSKEIGAIENQITWKWAFRYQWIIKS